MKLYIIFVCFLLQLFHTSWNQSTASGKKLHSIVYIPYGIFLPPGVRDRVCVFTGAPTLSIYGHNAFNFLKRGLSGALLRGILSCPRRNMVIGGVRPDPLAKTKNGLLLGGFAFDLCPSNWILFKFDINKCFLQKIELKLHEFYVFHWMVL